ncbi:hypothetical protein [Streptomyces caeruleatus]|uniref:hypothetical protein n=1 Tax=Streptomyces caeruleatus TaxID=661399 RepID=UPI00131EA903|nr:hypothetical protein [Streptomyces caeruleatus]
MSALQSSDGGTERMTGRAWGVLFVLCGDVPARGPALQSLGRAARGAGRNVRER